LDSGRRIAAVVFDLDGTLTRPFLNFEAIRRDMRLPPGEPILEAMDRMTGQRRAEADAVLLAHERAAAAASELNDGAVELLARAAALRLPAGVLTRNCTECAADVLRRHRLHFDSVVCREDAPVKPAPDGVHLSARRLGTAPDRLLVVGDYLFDILAGKRAGALTALLTAGRVRAFDGQADFLLPTLHAGIELLDRLCAGG
jgi:HAD superfamily hydrolase (TIGR01549 family)